MNELKRTIKILLLSIVGTVLICLILSYDRGVHGETVPPGFFERVKDYPIEERTAIYTHHWNMAAYCEGSLIRFYSRCKDNLYWLVIVNIDVDLNDEESVKEHELIIKDISEDWFKLTESRIVDTYSYKDLGLILWVDKDGEVHQRED